MRTEATEQRGNVVSYRKMIQGFDCQSEDIWKTNRYGVDERARKFPEIRDHKFDGGIHPAFEEIKIK